MPWYAWCAWQTGPTITNFCDQCSRTLRAMSPGGPEGRGALHQAAARNYGELYGEHSREGITERRPDRYRDLHELPHRSPCPIWDGSGIECQRSERAGHLWPVPP